jgi:peroxiredoxin
MMRRATWLTAVTAMVLLAGAAHAGRLEIGAPIPSADSKMENVDGRSLSIADIHGEKGTLVIFACNHCPWVQAWQQRMVALGNEYSTKGIGVVCVNSNDPSAYPTDDLATMQQVATREGYQFPYVVDATSDVARAFGATRTPEAFLFDAAGRLVYHGAIDDNAHEPDRVEHRYLRDALDALLAGRPVAPAEVPFIGCTIKFRAKP